MKSRKSKIPKQKVFILALISLGCIAFVALLIKLNDAYEAIFYGNPGDMSWKKNLGFLKLKHEKIDYFWRS